MKHAALALTRSLSISEKAATSNSRRLSNKVRELERSLGKFDKFRQSIEKQL
jgi:hypothetical protein